MVALWWEWKSSLVVDVLVGFSAHVVVTAVAVVVLVVVEFCWYAPRR